MLADDFACIRDPPVVVGAGVAQAGYLSRGAKEYPHAAIERVKNSVERTGVCDSLVYTWYALILGVFSSL